MCLDRNSLSFRFGIPTLVGGSVLDILRRCHMDTLSTIMHTRFGKQLLPVLKLMEITFRRPWPQMTFGKKNQQTHVLFKCVFVNMSQRHSCAGQYDHVFDVSSAYVASYAALAS